jgi:hypothetical protein
MIALFWSLVKTAFAIIDSCNRKWQQNKKSAKAKLEMSAEVRLVLDSFFEQRHNSTSRLPRRPTMAKMQIGMWYAKDVTPVTGFVELLIC